MAHHPRSGRLGEQVDSSQMFAQFPTLSCFDKVSQVEMQFAYLGEAEKRKKKKKLNERHRHTGRIKTLGGKRKARCDSEWLSG